MKVAAKILMRVAVYFVSQLHDWSGRNEPKRHQIFDQTVFINTYSVIL